MRFKRGDWEFIKTVVIAVTLAVIFRSFAYEPFHIPSGSMKANLLVGDYIFVTKYSYGYSRYSFPFGARFDYFDGRSGNSSRPMRGDVVVFRPPGNPSTDFIKRVMGLPGDRIQVKGGVVYINGEKLPKAKSDRWEDEDENKTIDRYEETLPGGKKIFVLDEKQDGEVDDTEEYTVPAGRYFVMGDNRDNSRDSRYPDPVGFVPEENLVGRADIIMLSFRDLTHPRWDRFFKLIH